ncbi:MAG: hypothetical protein GY730_11340 [bacterium]|nr:hypothetical protein [bacterium]
MAAAFTEFDLIINTLKSGTFDFLVKRELDIAVINQKVIQALHKQNFENFFHNLLEQ